ncbi:MAG TPA: hypothetical protein VK489_11620 [Ferruginibacter sp.]|nr:hypothetical protein [Ferruginibacter sp.]
MLDEEMDDIIKNAASKHHPAYNDEAWEKMELKLDKHLPQKKDRRKFIFFLLFFLLLGSGALLTVVNFTGNKNTVNGTLAETTSTVKQPTTTTTAADPAPVDEKTGPGTEKMEPGNENTVPVNENSATATGRNKDNPVSTLAQDPVQAYNNNNDPNNIPANEAIGKNKRTITRKKGRTNMSISAAGLFDETITATEKKTNTVTPKTKNTVDKAELVVSGTNPEEKETGDAALTPLLPKTQKNTLEERQKEMLKEDKKDKAVKEKEKVKEITATKPSPSPEKKKDRKNPFSNFGITASVGPDLSFVKLNNTGKTTLNYGAGLSYNFAKRFTARTGFYVSKKIYSATPEQYTMPGTTYPYLDMVDADCKIYEIPLSLSYDILQRKKYNLFGGVGISSYLMKTETYDYNYKYPYGQTYVHREEVKNENKHYFSVLTLSAGYQYNISKRVSIQAEPYIKLPLGGVGIGKIKLNSAGLLFTATVKPFAKAIKN